MLEHLIAFMMQPDQHACAWRDGELYILPVEDLEAERASQCEREDEQKIAA